MQRYFNNVQDFQGNAQANVTVTVRLAGTSTLANLFSDTAGTVKSNPFVADSDGEFFFYASNGRYDIQLQGDFVSETKLDRLLFDPDDAGIISATQIQTGNFNAAKGFGYFVDVTSGAITITLPASPVLGDAGIVITHFKGDIAANNITVSRNGNNIMGLAEDMIINTPNASVQLKYSDAAGGWRIVVTNV